MGDDLRDRFFTPFVLPVTIIGVMLLVGLSLSRVLLTVSELSASFVALLAAGYILLAAFWVAARKRISARSLGVALAIGLIGLVGAGAAAAAAGMRDLEEHTASEAGGGEGGGGDGGAASNEPVFVAIDIEYESAPSELPTGDVDLTFENDGSIEHNVVIEELGDEVILEAAGGETDEATVSLEAGEYTYYCSIPGHRATMEGTFTASDDVGAASGSGGGGGEEEPSEPGADTSESASEGG
jgi:plastocyanin